MENEGKVKVDVKKIDAILGNPISELLIEKRSISGVSPFPNNPDIKTFLANYMVQKEGDTKDVVMRNPRSSSRYLLADGGDGSEADLLGTTPPRSRIRDKEKQFFNVTATDRLPAVVQLVLPRNLHNSRVFIEFLYIMNYLESGAGLQRAAWEKKDVDERPASPDLSPERLRKRSSLKLIRSKERDFKLDMGQQSKADSLPSPNPMAAPVPTLVESCSRFMSLTSKPKCREVGPATETETAEPWQQERDEQLPANRVGFHKTFSMLINMGNIDKTCRRTISREEQVWQNELKDLIWLELQARVAGRSLAAQDAWLCAQRQQVPALVRNISEYRFVNKNPCRRQAKRTGDTQSSREDLTDSQLNDDGEIHNY
ncbi:Mitogen-activated protein kinase kinase kinase 4 [Operophtera brumata]|uniref:Mitogen-activated protein kinase kinase kinase 4 n=1 Tax=Operophtera brumata TaxID=104452 RepID=A0A0L7LJD6_OPEBR|nr:Mitogen-activated protein kinase kinase kinase 4 [Operophtera brumata]